MIIKIVLTVTGLVEMAVVVSVEWANAKGLESDSYAAGHGVGNDTKAHPERGRYIFNFCLKKKKKNQSCSNSH